MQAGPKKNMDRMVEVIPDAKSRNLQQFLTLSSWDARAVIDHVAQECWKSLDLRDTTRCRLKILCWSTPIYIWKGKIAEVYKWQLVATKSAGRTADIKFSITNVPRDPAETNGLDAAPKGHRFTFSAPGSP
jgi:hypothetical protein